MFLVGHSGWTGPGPVQDQSGLASVQDRSRTGTGPRSCPGLLGLDRQSGPCPLGAVLSGPGPRSCLRGVKRPDRTGPCNTIRSHTILHQQKPEWLILGSEGRRATQSLPIGGERAHSSVIFFHSSIIAQSARDPIAIACNPCARRWLSCAIAPLVFECALAKGRSRQDACPAMGRAGD